MAVMVSCASGYWGHAFIATSFVIASSVKRPAARLPNAICKRRQSLPDFHKNSLKMPRSGARRDRSPSPEPKWTFVRENGHLIMFHNRRRRSRSPFERNRGPPRQRSPFRNERERSPPRGPRGLANPIWRPRSRSPLRERGPPLNRFNGPNSWRRGRSPSPGSGKTSEGGSRRQSPRRSPPPNRYRPAPGGDLIRDRPLSDRVEREHTRSPFIGNKRDDSQGRDTGSINSRSTPRERSRSPVRGRDISPMSRDAPASVLREAPRVRSPLPPRVRSPSPRESLQIRGRAGGRSPPRGPAQPFRAPTGPREGQRFGEGRFGFDGPGGGPPGTNNNNNGFNKRPSFNAGGANSIPVRSPNPTTVRHTSTTAAAPTGPARDKEQEEVGGSVERHKGAIVWTSKHAQPPSAPASQQPALNASATSFEPATTTTSNTTANSNNANTATATTPSAPPAKVSPPIAPRGFVPSGPRGGGGYRGGRQSFSADRRPSYTPSENNNNNHNHNSGWGAAPAAPRAALQAITTILNTQQSNASVLVTTPATPKAVTASPATVNPTPSPARTPIQQTPTQPRSATPIASQTPTAIPTGPRASLSGASGNSMAASSAGNNNNAMDWSSTGPTTIPTPTAVRRESSVSATASAMHNNINPNANAPVNAPSGPAAQAHNGWGITTSAPSGPAAHNSGWGNTHIPHKPNFTTGWGQAASSAATGWGNTPATPFNPSGPSGGLGFANAPARPTIHPALSNIQPLIPGGKLDPASSGLNKELEARMTKGREEEERLRREVWEREEKLRGQRRGWEKGERESKSAGLRAELSGACLEGLVGVEGGGSRAF